MDIILFSTADWDNPFWTNKQHMAKTFEKHGHKIIYIDSLGIRKPKLDKRDALRILKRFKALFKPYKKVSDKIWVVSPFVIPFHKYKTIRFLNDFLLSFTIQVLMWTLRFRQPLIWTYSPVTDIIIDKFKASKIIYHCVDDLSSLPNVDQEVLRQRENNLIKKSDYIFTTSTNLFERIQPLNPNTYYQNNVCDYEHFSSAKYNNFMIPPDIEHISNPKIVFVGALSSYKVNFELLASIAKKHSNWQLLLIGQIGEGQPETKIDILKEHKNIHLLGPKPYNEIPHYLHFSSVAIIPSHLNDYTKSMFPMKFFEYLSAGLQVVTSNLSSLHDYRSLAYICKDDLEFEESLVKILDKHEFKDTTLIEQECQKHTWDSRYLKMMQIMELS